MYYVLLDEESHVIGVNPETAPNDDNIWYRATQAAYEKILGANGENPYIDPNFRLSMDTTIDADNILVEKETPLEVIIRNKCAKTTYLCEMYITDGIIYYLNGERKHFTYTAVDQINFSELNDFITLGILDSESGIPIKASGEEDWIFVDIPTFTDIYQKLIKNKYYHLFRKEVLNKYISTLTDSNVIYRMDYEVALPQEYEKEIENKMKKFKFKEMK